MDASTDRMDAIHDDVAEFALLLTRLKARTDRSYSALAHRLGMNASTLHRYCAGEAVPMDFTGIERFAALCGASHGHSIPTHYVFGCCTHNADDRLSGPPDRRERCKYAQALPTAARTNRRSASEGSECRHVITRHPKPATTRRR